MNGWRHARAILLLPGTVVVAVPTLILVADGGPTLDRELDGAANLATVLLGLALIGAGFALWAWTAWLFARRGQGTLAPWDPTKRLVIEGPYRHVRNPMISAVLAILLGEAALLGSLGIAIWAAAFGIVNHAYFLLAEEPGLERRFGDEYRAYKRAVPRWVPRRST
jgi:protein-S-isoprenylcysteine O-methyltransferase Ste14